eukprot:TRINITY_DN14284_c0_g1_i2.p1 TRINITY_DN14284_c0_g1~~TRINITY_DN14284_c0_g1_i2.p1  ORF type:complete len:1081 (-),score=244.64 TRINITY_DN14284_c0_g1_i2:1211-4453(-)
MKNPLEGASSLSTPGLLLGTIASVGSSSNVTKASTWSEDSLKKNSFSSFDIKTTIGRGESSGKENEPKGTGSLSGTLGRENSFLNRSSLGNLETPSTLNRLGSLDRRQTSSKTETSSSFKSNTVGRRANSVERKSLIDDGNWLSLDRRGKSSRDLTSFNSGSSLVVDNNSKDQSGNLKRSGDVEIEIQRNKSPVRDQSNSPAREQSKSPSRSKSRDRSESPEKEGYGDLSKARSFWKTLDNDTVRRQSQDFGSRRESQDFSSRRESHELSVRRESSGSVRQSQEVGISQKTKSRLDDSLGKERGRSSSYEPEPDYDTERNDRLVKKSKHKSSKTSKSIQRQSQIVKKRRDSIISDAPTYAERAKSPEYDRGRRGSSADKEDDLGGQQASSTGKEGGRRGSSAGRDMEYALIKADSNSRDYEYESLSRRSGTQDSRRGSTNDSRRNSSHDGRRGSIYNDDINRDGFSSGNELALAKRRETNPDESKHFLSLQLFSQHAEPSLDEFLPIEKQLELEHRQREEEDALYRIFLQERRENEDIVANMEENDREELFERMNKMERSRIINLADKHCTQIMDLIHREKVIYLQEGGEETAEIMANYPREPPPIQPPQFKKTDVYENNMAVFEVIDETAKTAATETYKTFSNLVRVLVGRCASELDKARAIFRYITEKKFNHRSWFLYYPEEGNTRGAPTELLRGVEFGIETKALLFKRMCAYAGLHAIVIKGFCKAKDYKPAEEFVDNRWRNAWNAVYVAGGWRLVQPNWAAMQVNTKAARETRQIYQDHYFLTDADKFIFEFFPKAAEHQFLEHPITKEEFEQLPLLRSTFFHFGLGLARSEGLIQASVHCDEKGEANIYLNSQNDVSFHYTLTNFKTGSTSVKAPGGKFPLGRFVMMSTRDEETNFNIHVPHKGNYLLEIGAARYPTALECLAKKPIYYINVCKFKIVCKTVEKVMVPLPDCVPGEWGPTKAEKLFGLRGTSHPMPIIYAAPPSNIDLREDGRPLTLNIEFEKTRPVLDFVTKLYKNGVKEEDLKQGARYRIKDQYVIFDIKVPQDGQYGLDIYTRENWDDKMLHCCKYLINCDV